MFSMGKRPKPKPFGFKPRYYDQAKEELELRLGRYDKDKATDPELTKARIRQGLKMRMRPESSNYNASSRKSNIRLVGIILVLTFVSVAILQSDKILRMIQVFSGGSNFIE